MGHGVRVFFRRLSKAASVLAVLMSPIYAEDAATSLFKVITVKDEIVIGLSAAELDQLGGRDAGAVAKSLAGKGTLSVWQYAVRKAPNGDLEQAPLRKIGLIAHDSLRVEPYSTPLKVLPHDEEKKNTTRASVARDIPSFVPDTHSLWALVPA